MKQKSQLIWVVLITIALLMPGAVNAQFDSSFVRGNLIKCADSMAWGFRARNWEVFARYTNPAIIGSMGGKAEFINFTTGVFGQIPDSSWKVYKPGKVLQLVKSGNDFQSIIELNSVIEWEGRRITAVNHLVGQSWDGGVFWTFFDSQNSQKSATQIKPDLSPDLVVPAKVPEKVEPIRPASPLKPVAKPIKQAARG